MPHVSLREIRQGLRDRRSTKHLVHACLIVEAPDGTEIVRSGGLWDPNLSRYVDPESVGLALDPQRIRLQESQVALMRGLAAWLQAAREGKPRPVVVMSGGNPGSGKTFAIAGIFCHLVALEWPGDEQFASNLNSDNRRECLHHMQLVGRAEWITEIEDPRRAHVAWCNGSRLTWVSARNEKKLRQRGLPIRHVLINEAQLQSERLYATAQQAPRALGGLCTITMNPATTDGGNWTTRLWYGIESGEINGKVYQLYSAQNAAVDHNFIDDAGKAIRVATPRLAGAEVDGIIGNWGPTAYPSFDGRPCNHADPSAGGVMGSPPELGWQNVTREATASMMGGAGADVVIGCDFQKHPGCAGVVAQLYRTADRRLVLYVERVIGVPGQEDSFSQALVDAGYTTNGYRGDGSTGPKALLIGDATGDRQNSEHKRWLPPSYRALEAHGWVIKPPMYHHKTRTPWNPAVLESIDQMFVVFERREILLGPRCREVVPEFGPSLVDCLRNAQKNSFGKLKKGEVFQHAPDCLRYLAWAFLPKPQPKVAPMDRTTYEAMKSLRLASGRDE